VGGTAPHVDHFPQIIKTFSDERIKRSYRVNSRIDIFSGVSKPLAARCACMSNLPPFRLWRYWRAYSTHTIYILLRSTMHSFLNAKNKHERLLRLTFFHVDPSRPTTSAVLLFDFDLE